MQVDSRDVEMCYADFFFFSDPSYLLNSHTETLHMMTACIDTVFRNLV